MANVALAAGLLALVGAVDTWVALLDGDAMTLGFLAIPVAVVCGALGRRDADRRGRAAAGIVMGVAAALAIILGVVLLFFGHGEIW